jgi:hypothetical protein
MMPRRPARCQARSRPHQGARKLKRCRKVNGNACEPERVRCSPADTALADTASTKTWSRQLRAARPAHRRPHRLAPPARSPRSPGCSISFLRSPTPEGNTMMVERQVSIDTIDAIILSLVARVDHCDPVNAPRAATWASPSTCTPRSGRTVTDRSPGLSPTGTPVARGCARLRRVTTCCTAGVSPNISRRRAPSARHGCRVRHPWSTGMNRASPCRRPRADRADVVSFGTTKTNSSSHFFRPCCEDCSTWIQNFWATCKTVWPYRIAATRRPRGSRSWWRGR